MDSADNSPMEGHHHHHKLSKEIDPSDVDTQCIERIELHTFQPMEGHHHHHKLSKEIDPSDVDTQCIERIELHAFQPIDYKQTDMEHQLDEVNDEHVKQEV
eukprot:230613_1